MENTCIPMADSCQCMAKPIQYCKVKKKKEWRGPSSPGYTVQASLNLTFYKEKKKRKENYYYLMSQK